MLWNRVTGTAAALTVPFYPLRYRFTFVEFTYLWGAEFGVWTRFAGTPLPSKELPDGWSVRCSHGNAYKCKATWLHIIQKNGQFDGLSLFSVCRVSYDKKIQCFFLNLGIKVVLLDANFFHKFSVRYFYNELYCTFLCSKSHTAPIPHNIRVHSRYLKLSSILIKLNLNNQNFLLLFLNSLYSETPL